MDQRDVAHKTGSKLKPVGLRLRRIATPRLQVTCTEI